MGKRNKSHKGKLMKDPNVETIVFLNDKEVESKFKTPDDFTIKDANGELQHIVIKRWGSPDSEYRDFGNWS